MVAIDSTFAIAAGLLASTMTPCLIQLVFFYFAAISGVSVSDAHSGAITPDELAAYRRKVIWLAVAFAIGVMLVFTISGFLVGYLGEEIREIPLWSGHAIWAQRIAGVGFLVLGVWMANVTRAPIVCKIPFPKFRHNPSDLSMPAMLALGFVFMFGCASCFSGAIFAALLVYVGATAAPLQGALVMFFFGLGVTIPLVLAAGLLSKVYPHFARVQRASRYMGLVSSLFIIAFGLVAVAGEFHTLSDIIWRLITR